MQLKSVRSLSRFKGLNTVADPMSGTPSAPATPAETWGWQSRADNVDGTDSEALSRREGYWPVLAASRLTGSFSTFDFSRMYLIDAGQLLRVLSDMSTLPLYTGLAGTAYWAEINDVVYLSCGAAKLRIGIDDRVSPWSVPTPRQPNISDAMGSLPPGTYQAVLTYADDSGREGGACSAAALVVGASGGFTLSDIPPLPGYSPQLYMTEADGTVFYFVAELPGQTAYTVTAPPTGRELLSQFMEGVPEGGGPLAFFGARAYVAEYLPELDQTVIWFSQPLGYHLFDLNADYFLVPGEVTQVFGAPDALLVGTHNRLFLFDGDKIQQAADYGAIPGQHAEYGKDGKVYFWTNRGLCRIAPFENLTEARVSVAPGAQAGGGIIERGGYRKYVAVIQQGGAPFNAR